MFTAVSCHTCGPRGISPFFTTAVNSLGAIVTAQLS